MTFAETTTYSGGTPISSLPASITTPGVYYLTQNFVLSSDVNGITIQVPNVTVDFNGHSITNTFGTGISARGVNAFNKANVTIRNGTITGFYYGVSLVGAGSTNALVENMTFVKNYWGALAANGTRSRVYRCTAVQTGGSTLNNIDASMYLYGISVYSNTVVEDCKVFGKTGPSKLIGIQVTGDDCVLLNNRISGIEVGTNTNAGSVTKYRDNLTFASELPYSNGLNAGNNN